MKTTDKIYQNALEINSMSLQIIAWINEMRSKQDQIVAIPTRHTPQPREDSAIAEIADCQLNNNFQDFLKMQNEEIMKRKYGKGSYIKRFKRRKDGSIYTYYFVHKSLHKFFAKYKKSPLFATLHRKLQRQNTKK